MKKLYALLLITSSVLTAYDTDYSQGWYTEHGPFKYKYVWSAILEGDYKLALEYLDDIRSINVEDDVHQDLIQLMMAVKMHDRQLQRQIILGIEEKLESVIDE